MISAKDLNLFFGQQVVLDDVSFNINKDQKIGLVGRNGSGKTTLLKIIAGLQGVDSGNIAIQKDCKIAYMPQDVVLLSDKTIYQEAFSVFEKLNLLENEAKELEELLHDHKSKDNSKNIDKYSHIQNQLLELDYSQAQVETKKILMGLGISQEDFNKKVDTLSVGWKMRLVLAKLLLRKADFYLFDEPTNHLDLVAKDWFLGFLKDSEFGFLLVCHDRYFLDNLCNQIFEISNGKLKNYTGNYTKYLQQKELDLQLQEKKYLEQQKFIKKQKEVIERFRASATKAKMAQSMIKTLEKIELIKIDPKQKTVNLKLGNVQRSGRVVLNVKKLAKSFGDKKVFKNASFEIERGQKVAIVAPNGMGKTTLLNLITDKLSPDCGTILFGHNVQTAFFQQDQNRSLDLKKTILQEVEDSCTTSETRAKVRGLLGAFLFPGDDVYKQISVLSGGEKNRVAMIKVLLQGSNFLILDEPTNHLDIESKEILLSALKQFDGTILFVSHDRDFLNKLADHILELTCDGVAKYSGNYDSFLLQKSEQEKILDKKDENQKSRNSISGNIDKNQDYKLKKRISNLESKIEKIEKGIKQLYEKLAYSEYNSDEYNATYLKIKELEKQLAESVVLWEDLHE